MEVQLTGPIELRFELPETKKMKPSLLIELFKMAIEEVDDNTVTNANELFLRIKELDLNEDQINQIFSLSKIIYSHSVEPALKLDYFNFYSSHLTMKNVFAYLKSAKNADSETHVQKCLDYIKKMIGVKIDRIKDLLLVNIQGLFIKKI